MLHCSQIKYSSGMGGGEGLPDEVGGGGNEGEYGMRWRITTFASLSDKCVGVFCRPEKHILVIREPFLAVCKLFRSTDIHFDSQQRVLEVLALQRPFRIAILGNRRKNLIIRGASHVMTRVSFLG